MMMPADVEFANVSDPGRKRPHNEDSSVTDRHLGLALVADGMGGYKAGEVASAIAAKAVVDGVREGGSKHRFVRAQRGNGQASSAEAQLIRECIQAANKHIYDTAHALPQCQGMGTTIVAAMFSLGRVTIAHVGDSRIYRSRGDELKQVTSDHSLVQELIDRGFFTPEEAQAFLRTVHAACGSAPGSGVEVDVQELETEAGDIFLLCSDGLNDMVNDEEIRLTLSKYSANLFQAAQELVRLANQGGGKDNISVVLARPRQAQSGRAGLLAKVMGLFTRRS